MPTRQKTFSTLVSFLFFLSFFNCSLNAQCIADAGGDLFLCHTLWNTDTAEIGGMPTALNGTPPGFYFFMILAEKK